LLPPTSFIDLEELPDGVPFTYKIRANYKLPACGTPNNPPCPYSGLSDPATVTAKNDAPARPAGVPPAFDYVTDKAFTVPAAGLPSPFLAATDVDTAGFGPNDTTLANKLRGPKPPSGVTPQNPIVTGPFHGTLSNLTYDSKGMWTGGFTYTPVSGYSGPDSFTFQLNDGLWNGDNSTVLSSNVTGAVSINVKPKKK